MKRSALKKGIKILIADDEKDAASLIKEFLGKKGFDADVVYDGARALELIKLNKYDLVFLDHNMPEITGLELIEYIKKNYPQTKAVMITGYQQIEGCAVKDLGVDEYLIKPFKLQCIEDIVNRCKSAKV